MASKQRRLEDLLAGVSPATLDSPCSDDHLMELALGLSDWQEVALFLRLEDSEMMEVQEEAKGVRARNLKVLRRWRERFGEHATYRSLADVLWKLGRTDQVEKICNLVSAAPLASSHGSLPPPDVTSYADEDNLSDGADTDEEADAERMPEAQREILGEYTAYLSERMVPEKVVEGLQKLGVFDRHYKEIVLAKQTTKEKNEAVIEIVMRGGTDAFPKFVRVLQRIHSSLAKELRLKLNPVKCRVLWLAESASHAAIVVHTLEKPEYAGVRFDDVVRAPGCLFRCGVVSGHETRGGMEQVEIIVVFPVHESLLSEAMESAFTAVCPQADIAVMCGVCKGRGENVKSGDTIVVTQAVENSQTVPWNSIGPKIEFIQVLSSHLQQLFTTTPLWLANVNQKEASMQYQSLWLTRLYIELQKVHDSRWLHSLGWDMPRPSLLNEHNQATVDRNCSDWKNGKLVASLLKQRSWHVDQSSPIGLAPNPALLTQVQEHVTFDPDYPPQPPNHPLGMPHFGAIETLTDKTEQARTHDGVILGSDANSFMFYHFCNSKLGPGKPWFVCKGVPHEGGETRSVMASTCLLVEVMEIFAIEMDATTI